MHTDLSPREHDAVRRFLTQAVTAHEGVDLDDPADYWYRLGQRNAHAHAAGLLIAAGDAARADAIADRIVPLLSDTLPTPAVKELYAAALAPFPPTSVHRGTPQLRWLEPKAWAATTRLDPGGVDAQYGGTWGPRHDTAFFWRHHPNATVGMLYAHDGTWDEYAILADRVDERDVDAAYGAACRSATPVSAERFAALLPTPGRELSRQAPTLGAPSAPDVGPAGVELGR